MLKRTELKYIVSLIWGGGGPGERTTSSDETLDEMREKAYEELEQVLKKHVPDAGYDEVLDEIGAYSSSSYQAGLFIGIKAGARLFQNLTDDSPIIV
jgi:hypothetical protein